MYFDYEHIPSHVLLEIHPCYDSRFQLNLPSWRKIWVGLRCQPYMVSALVWSLPTRTCANETGLDQYHARHSGTAQREVDQSTSQCVFLTHKKKKTKKLLVHFFNSVNLRFLKSRALKLLPSLILYTEIAPGTSIYFWILNNYALAFKPEV